MTMPLEALGQRIMVCGPSNAGKSTLAVALARKLGATPFHVDLFRHQPDTNWVQRPGLLPPTAAGGRP